MTDPLAFALTALALLAAPGPTNALLAISGSGAGWRGAPPYLLATVGAYLIAILLLMLALAPLADSLPAAMSALRIACAVYLLVISVKLWRSSFQLGAMQKPLSVGSAFTTTLLNPKSLVFATSVFPTGLGAGQLLPYFAVFALICVAVSAAWFRLGALAASGGTHGRAHCLICRLGSMALAGFSGMLSAAALG